MTSSHQARVYWSLGRSRSAKPEQRRSKDKEATRAKTEMNWIWRQLQVVDGKYSLELVSVKCNNGAGLQHTSAAVFSRCRRMRLARCDLVGDLICGRGRGRPVAGKWWEPRHLTGGQLWRDIFVDEQNPEVPLVSNSTSIHDILQLLVFGRLCLHHPPLEATHSFSQVSINPTASTLQQQSIVCLLDFCRGPINHWPQQKEFKLLRHSSRSTREVHDQPLKLTTVVIPFVVGLLSRFSPCYENRTTFQQIYPQSPHR